MKKPDVIEHTTPSGGNDDRDSPVKVYTPKSPIRRPQELFAAMLSDLVASRELAWRLFLRDIRARYRNSLLGYGWVFIPPLVAALPFIFLKSQGVIDVGDTPLPYGAYAMIGTMIWQVFVDALNSPLQSVSASVSMLTRINFQREALLLSGLMQVGLGFLIRLVLLAAILILYGITLPLTALLFPFGILGLVLSGFAIGLMLTPIGMLYGDVQRVLAVIVPLWMLLTPVLYPQPRTGIAGIVIGFNPLTPLVTVTRDWLTLGTSTDVVGFMIVCTLMFGVLVASWIIFRVASPHILSRLGN